VIEVPHPTEKEMYQFTELLNEARKGKKIEKEKPSSHPLNTEKQM